MRTALLFLLLLLSACAPLAPHKVDLTSGKTVIHLEIQREQPTNVLTSLGEPLSAIATQILPFLGL